MELQTSLAKELLARAPSHCGQHTWWTLGCSLQLQPQLPTGPSAAYMAQQPEPSRPVLVYVLVYVMFCES